MYVYHEQRVICTAANSQNTTANHGLATIVNEKNIKATNEKMEDELSKLLAFGGTVEEKMIKDLAFAGLYSHPKEQISGAGPAGMPIQRYAGVPSQGQSMAPSNGCQYQHSQGQRQSMAPG